MDVQGSKNEQNRMTLIIFLEGYNILLISGLQNTLDSTKLFYNLVTCMKTVVYFWTALKLTKSLNNITIKEWAFSIDAFNLLSFG